jgi:phage tail sheath gpL-like
MSNGSLTQTQSSLRLDITLSELAANQIKPESSSGADAPRFAQGLGVLFNKMADGADSFSIVETQGGTAAQATVTFASTGPTNTQTCTVGNVTLTAVTSGATGPQFNISATPATVAANFAAAVNANCVGICTATNLLGVVTLTASAVGTIGNGLQLSVGNLSNVTLTHAFGATVAGAGTIYTSALGF